MKQRKETGAMATMRNPAEENFDETPAEALDHASRDSTSDDEGRGRAAGRAHKEEARAGGRACFQG